MNKEFVLDAVTGLQTIRDYAIEKKIKAIEIRANDGISAILSLVAELKNSKNDVTP